MRLTKHAQSSMSWVLALTLGITAGCSTSGSESSSTASNDLAITSISVVGGSTWKINRPIDVGFDKDIDFATVNLNTFQVVDLTGVSASGIFIQPLDVQGNVLTKVIRFQPTCPTEDDFSDAGLKINTNYSLRVAGVNDIQGGITLQSTAGDYLALGAVVNFVTPNSTLPETLFLDTVPGPPSVRVRGLGSVPVDSMDATFLQVGGDAPRYFGTNGLGAYDIPLNLYSDPRTRIALMLYLNQPVLASSANINSNQISFEYESTPGTWSDISTEVVLEQNCVLSGSILRVTPLGLIPQGSNIRVSMRQGFVDLTGDPTPQDNTNFAVMASTTVLDSGGLPGEAADELLEEFVISGSFAGSLEDTQTPLGSPRAVWGETGKLEASFAFGGTGGPGGTFDYHVPAGQTISINTTTATIVGGPGGAPTASQTIIGGVMDVRNLYVPAGSRLLFVGPNPVTILASGTVIVEGEISIRGGNNDGVGTLGTTFQPESGSAGNAGGGKGGTGSFLTSSSTPRGGVGSGPFNVSGGGGGGGETTYTTSSNKDVRRGAGGGGGGMGPDIFYDHDDDPMTIDRHCQILIGMDGEDGFGGAAQGTGAVSQSVRAEGGYLGPDPFVDDREDNNFYGTLITSTGALIVGELDNTWAGAGGGGGGDAAQVTSTGFPRIPFQTSGDEKGSGAGGGAGGISILAIGSITVEDGGRIVADGGYGGGGENVIFFDRIGGAGGGGAGGHIVLSSATFIDVKGIAANAGDGYRDTNAGHRDRPLSALGGQGGAGHANHGGANESGSTTWRCDAIDLARLNVDGNFVTTGQGVIGTAADVPPLFGQSACFRLGGMADWLDVEGPSLASGGDGSPGIIQMHVDDPAANLRFAGGLNWGNADVTKSASPTPIGWNGVGEATDDFVAFFGRVSVAQSEWIPLGLARVDPLGGPDEQVSFFFEGTDPATGFVNRNSGGFGPLVDPLPVIIAPTLLNAIGSGSLPFVDLSGLLISIDGSALVNAYKANPNLLKGFHVVLDNGITSRNFSVAGARWQPADKLEIFLGGTENFIDDYLSSAGGTPTVSLRPNFFQVSSQGVVNNYAPNTGVRIRFDATMLGPDGEPDESVSFSSTNAAQPASDITDLNAQNWDVFRFRVEFDLNTGGGGVNPLDPRPSLEFLRMPFTF
ncbi:MAG: hypothetical protein ACI89E_000117 [Planctomycetota bacterium]|jgi:hypothetical protein